MIRLLDYYWQAKTKRNIEHPFVRELMDKVVDKRQQFPVFDKLEGLRDQLAKTDQTIVIQDLGAGSKKSGQERRKVSKVLKYSVSPKWQCQFLFHLVTFLNARNRLELGTSLGISSLYQYLANFNSPMLTLEGSPELARMARQHFKSFEAQHLQLIEGPFEQTLAPALEQLGQLDYVFLDGNHALIPSLQYFDLCLPYLHQRSVLVIDDIYWSEEMTEAWERIKAHPRVRLTLDLYWAGLVFFSNGGEEPQHFTGIASRFKPWVGNWK